MSQILLYRRDAETQRKTKKTKAIEDVGRLTFPELEQRQQRAPRYAVSFMPRRLRIKSTLPLPPLRCVSALRAPRYAVSFMPRRLRIKSTLPLPPLRSRVLTLIFSSSLRLCVSAVSMFCRSERRLASPCS